LKIESASFVKSSESLLQCPSPDIPEYAFIGRSNVGKSSLINMLCGVKNLAKTSSMPGKTRLINHFLINGKWYLVDLPGYGFAKVSKTSREKWGSMLRNYLLKRPSLVSSFILIDSRLSPQASDLEFMEWMGSKQLPFCLVFTKTDKLRSSEYSRNLEHYRLRLLDSWEELPPIFVTSSEEKTGREEILGYIEENNSLFRKG
jgi:GTP-binding protein